MMGREAEKERAAFYQEHKDDPEVWEEDVREEEPKRSRGRPSRGLKATITVRFSEDEAAIIRSRASSAGQTYSEVVRQAVRQLESAAYSPSRWLGANTMVAYEPVTATGGVRGQIAIQAPPGSQTELAASR
jgi:uncharacterized protein (DUF4415 family)